MNTASVNGPRTLLRRMGTAAFFFFLAKGLMWLAAPFLFLWIN
jgi:hypothetical protein